MVAKLQLGERKLSTHFSKSSLQNKGAANPRVKTTGLIWMFTFTSSAGSPAPRQPFG